MTDGANDQPVDGALSTPQSPCGLYYEVFETFLLAYLVSDSDPSLGGSYEHHSISGHDGRRSS
jgi:hypothetical protein